MKRVDAAGPATGGLLGGPLSSYEDLAGASELYHRVFRYGAAGPSLNTNLLGALRRNGGSTVGVKTPEGRLVGFAYGFPGTDGRARYHYSQAAVVDPQFQGRHVGRMLKLCQREVALDWGEHRMRWSFDPLLARNAHFNFDSLGATGIALHEDYYGQPDTDRIIVEWDLDRDARAGWRRPVTPPVGRLGPGDWGRPLADATGVWLPIAGTMVSGDPESEEVHAQRPRVREVLAGLFADGFVATSCVRVDDRTAAYLLRHRTAADA